jgi:hypothetical protein
MSGMTISKQDLARSASAWLQMFARAAEQVLDQLEAHLGLFGIVQRLGVKQSQDPLALAFLCPAGHRVRSPIENLPAQPLGLPVAHIVGRALFRIAQRRRERSQATSRKPRLWQPEPGWLPVGYGLLWSGNLEPRRRRQPCRSDLCLLAKRLRQG